MTKMIKASEIRIGDTVTYCGTTFTAKRLTITGDMIFVTVEGQGPDQFIWGERDVEIAGRRGTKLTTPIHFNPYFLPEGVEISTREMHWPAPCNGTRPKLHAVTSDPRLVTCGSCLNDLN